MDKKHKERVIGYSGFILFEECYEYCEDACYIANSRDSIKTFMTNCGFDNTNFRVDEISIDKLVNDYGCSLGEYAMEKLAFEKFEKIANNMKIKYEYKDFYLDPELKVVNF